MAIVGAGLMGRWHAHYAVRAGAQIAAIVDRNATSSRTLRSRYPTARFFGDFRECLGEMKFDIVHVCTGTESHTELTLEALRGGKHVLVEKPVAGSAAETRRLVEFARQADLRLCPAHQFPFQSGFRRARRGLELLGELLSVDFHTCTAGGEGRPPSDRREVIKEILPHPLSLFRALGLSLEIREYHLNHSCDKLRINSFGDRDPSLGITIDLRGRPTRNELDLIGTRGSVYVDLYHGFCTFDRGATTRGAKIARPFRRGAALFGTAAVNLAIRTIRGEPAYPGLGRLIREFQESIRSGGRSPIGDEEMVEVAVTMDRVVDDMGVSQE